MPFSRRQAENTGSMKAYGAAAAPVGWLLCFGQAVSRTTYAALFAVIGTDFGVGDGATTFNLPDLRGRVPAGKDDMGGVAANRITNGGSGVVGTTLGAAGGAENVTVATATMPSHSHARTGTGGQMIGDSATGGFVGAGGGFETCSLVATGGGGAHNNLTPTQITTWIIKI